LLQKNGTAFWFSSLSSLGGAVLARSLAGRARAEEKTATRMMINGKMK
jgi:hypothetical protein